MLLKILVAVLIVPSSAAWADLNETQTAKLLGSTIGASVQASAPTGTQQLTSTTSLTVLGNTLPALQTVTGATNTINGTTYAEYYSFGKRVFSQNFYFQDNGIFEASAGLSPVEVDVPIVTYPVGPLVLSIDAGVTFQAAVSEQMMPTIMANDLADSTLEVKLSGDAIGTAFVEGDVTLVALRGGVGGEVNLVDGQVNLDGMFFFNGADPTVQYGALLSFLNGGIYAFAAVFDPLTFGWADFWQDTLFSFKGYCYAAGALSCPAN
jgi:hypothetical protein